MRRISPHKTTRLLLTIASGFGIACGGDSTAPQDTNAGVTGTWAVIATESGHGLSCQFRGLEFNLNQTGETFSGTWTAPADIQCRDTDGRVVKVGEIGSIVNGLVLTGEGGNIANGRVSGNQISFELKPANASLAGTLQGGEGMSGQGTDRIEFAEPIGTIEMALTWAAQRQ